MRRLQGRGRRILKPFGEVSTREREGVLIMTTLEKLRKAFKKASEDYERADTRYKKAIGNLYMPKPCYNDGTAKEFVSVSDWLIDEQGRFMHGYATDYSDVFGTFRNGRFYERPTAYYQLRNLEIDLNNAEKARNHFLIVCNQAQIDL